MRGERLVLLVPWQMLGRGGSYTFHAIPYLLSLLSPLLLYVACPQLLTK